MMPATGAKIVVFGASEEEMQMLRQADEKRLVYDDVEGKNQLISFERFEEPCEEVYDSDFVLDLRLKGILRIFPSDKTTQGEIFYTEKERAMLLDQVIQMLTGAKTLDADFADMIPILEKGCSFRYTLASEGELQEKGMKLIKEMLDSSNLNKPDILLQICDPVGLAESSAFLESLKGMKEIGNVVCQIIETADDTSGSIITVFMPVD